MHIPVLLEETLKILEIKKNGTYIDATTGCGGHAKGIVTRLDRGELVCIDRDRKAIACAKERLKAHLEKIKFVKGNFANLDLICKSLGIDSPDGILFDLGMSSLQLECTQRGFSFKSDGPLDMRMNSESEGPTAKDILNNYPESKLKKILINWGEERWAKRIARQIVKRREREEFRTTFQLTQAVKEAIPQKAQFKMNIHPATRTFQAIRIEVNNELENLKKGLHHGYEVLKKGGIMVVLSYHSLEDRIVKRFFKQREKDCICPPDLPDCVCDKVKEMEILTKSPITPTDEEVQENPKSRSAHLRVAKKIK